MFANFMVRYTTYLIYLAIRWEFFLVHYLNMEDHCPYNHIQLYTHSVYIFSW
jgi:hypothetical protein